MTGKQRKELDALLTFDLKEAIRDGYGLLVATGKLPMTIIKLPEGKEMETDAKGRPISLVKRD
jgi:hypothetical protein